MSQTSFVRPSILALLLSAAAAQPALAQTDPAKPTPTPPAQVQKPAAPAPPAQTTDSPPAFDLGKIVVVGNPNPEGLAGIGGTALDAAQLRTFERTSLDQAVNLAPGVTSTFDANGRRNESDIFVRGFGRWQVPLTIDGVRVYLPADNRLDFARFLTADIAAIQIQKGYASVLDGPGGMGGAINLVTRTPSKKIEAEASVSASGRDDLEGWNAYASAGTRRRLFYLYGSANVADRDYWTLSGSYSPTANSLQKTTRRISSDSADSRFNLKAGWTPRMSDEYTFNFIKQNGEKGAPLNVFNNPPVPANGFWRWPYWDLQNAAVLTRTRVGATSFVKTKWYYNTFANGLDAFDDITYTTQSNNGRFRSPYDDHAYGGDAEVDLAQSSSHSLKAAAHFRADVHKEQQTNRPTNPNPALATTEPVQTQLQDTWSVALEDTYHLRPRVDLVGGLSYETFRIRQAQEFTTIKGLFDLPKGHADSINWQGALIVRQEDGSDVHLSVSNRSRFPIIFELYSTRFGTATPNPDLGPERALNVEFGWKTSPAARIRFEGAIFGSRVTDLVQTVALSDATTQTQNVGTGHFYGAEFALDARIRRQLTAGGNYTYIRRTIVDGLRPNLQAVGVPTNKAFFYATWRPIARLTITPSAELATDRWSEVSPPSEIFIRTGAYALLNVSAEFVVTRDVSVVFGVKNMTDDDYQLSWGFPQPGRTVCFKTRVGFGR